MSEETKTPKPSLFGMITSPEQQLERIKERPIIWVAMLIVVILTVVGSTLQGMGLETPGLEEGGAAFLVIGEVFGGIIGVLLGVLIMSAIHMLIAKIALSDVSFKQLFSMNTYLGIITALGALLNGIVAIILGTDQLNMMFTSLGSLFNDVGETGAMGGVWNSIEVFSIWNFIVTALGLHIVAGFSKKLAWTIVIVFFLITVIFAMIGSAFPGMGGV